MMKNLVSLSTLFEKKLYRIPDYQRGYAWQKPQLMDFWDDLVFLDKDQRHYFGVLSVEPVQKRDYSKWDSDKWLFGSGYSAYYVVDGQQRLTTCIILISVMLKIIEEMNADGSEISAINYEPIEIIKHKFLYRQMPSTISVNSYIFGYESKSPSDEFFRTKILETESYSDKQIQSLYTHNLEQAKLFFLENINAKPLKQRMEFIEDLFFKITNQFLFNLYEIENDVSVYIAFETMNNRGKKLSTLELLKNRLIYLSTLFTISDEDQKILRDKINTCWGQIYFYLGKNIERPLNDDEFLQAHTTCYFFHNSRIDMSSRLLDHHFISKNVKERTSDCSKIEITLDYLLQEEVDDTDPAEPKPNNDIEVPAMILPLDVDAYVFSLQNAADYWSQICFPQDSHVFSTDEKLWLSRLNRIGFGYFRPLVLSAYLNKQITPAERVKLFAKIERFIFIVFRLAQAKSNYCRSTFLTAAKSILNDRGKLTALYQDFDKYMAYAFSSNNQLKPTHFKEFIANKFRASHGFYDWSGIKYFLYEYEYQLFIKSKSNSEKIVSWSDFVNGKDFETVEHIFPQNPSSNEWSEFFNIIGPEQRKSLTNSLGNLLALSGRKNSSLQNDSFAKKKIDRSGAHGYYNGSFSEIELVSTYQDWTPDAVKQRGLKMLAFLEQRWEVSLGDENEKISLLHLEPPL